MGKASKWIRSLLTGKKEKKEKEECNIEACYTVSTESPKTPIANLNNTHKEKRRWSFRRSVVTKDINSMDSIVSLNTPPLQVMLKHSIATKPSEVEEAAAIKIQSIFRSHLARKALCALKGLVKLQALVRGYLVRKQAATTFQCMQALLTVQARAQAQRIQAVGATKKTSQKQSIQSRFSSYNEIDRGTEEDIKTVEVDVGELRESSSKNRTNYSNHNHVDRLDHRYLSTFAGPSPRTFSGYFDEYTFSVEQNSPQHYSAVTKPDSMANHYSFFPNYMANTQSFRAKARSQSAPKQRLESYERQLSRRKVPAPIEGRNVPTAIRMQRSTSHVGSIANRYRFPWSMKLDKSMVSLKDSECSSTSTVLTDGNYSRSLVGYEVRNH